MLAVSQQITQALLNLTGGLQQHYRHNHERATAKHTMVASSRSSRGRANLPSDQPLSQLTTEPTKTSPTTVSPSHSADDSHSRFKRLRNASVSERDELQKRRRVTKSSGPPQVRIPLRGRASAPDRPVSPTTAPRSGPQPPQKPQPPPLLTHDSSISNSPLTSPALKPQYDQFKRIEEKAQRAGKKSAFNRSFSEDKRRLRSEDGGTRAKTELAQYFPSFDDMLSLEPVDPNDFSAKTPIVLLDDTPDFQPEPGRPDFFGTQKPLHNSTVIDLSQHLSPLLPDQDPLGEHVYLKAHQKAERHEKQMKNGDKERAQHEKYQLERLLEELRGPDWLKTLGISGITDTEKKRYEPKRSLFIKETRALIEKFKRWKEEEKRRKIERQQQLLEELEAEEDEAENTSPKPPRKQKSKADTDSRSRAGSYPVQQHIEKSGSDVNEIDQMASQQLLEEAKLASAQKKQKPQTQPPSTPTPVTEKPFTSFFEKQYIRDAAVAGRQRGRSVYAFGQQIPELEETEFELPQSILTDDAIRVSQRNRRRVRRGEDD